ncbi:DAK2 domain-containing protein [Butyrivibrio sp. XB500-5]|uniref:DAK2 domain-containing protein n=1 Tax=Butyrivibrio sp. XB500-5 TaxID=2364880 RepID=UPI000EAA8709|nr:DAK2 domain-containing protein [Butyrivibrio sp. XB500-5]RKM62561.1 DAK2 domain-containing protein [Butyrivibrio sp. XB500-5]
MSNNVIDAKMLSKMFLTGAKNLEAKKEWINELNVFPVPDGDTGTNMTMTIMSAAKEVGSLGDNADMSAICKAISSGSLRGARGNSGVILSQLLRGFTKVVKEHDEVNVSILAEAFDKAVETAYKAVMKPKEGTILTVAKGASEKAHELAVEGTEDIEFFCSEVIKYADEVLAKTPDMLPVLKQAGVVDSGGQGLVQVLKGALDGYLGKEIDITITEEQVTPGAKTMGEPKEEDIKFGYCTEFIVLLSKPLNIKQEIDFKNFLESIGDSIVMVADDEICKVHVHSNDPGLAIQRALMYGQLSNMKIDNMRMEHREKLFHENNDGSWAEIETEINGAAELTPTYLPGDDIPIGKKVETEAPKAAEPEMPHKEVGFVTVCAGSGLADIFRGLGVDYVIEGGQTMNPSTADILDAVDKVNADTVIVLPNNKNIILAANQAAIMSEDNDSDKKIVVVPSKTVPQGITAIINYVPDTPVEDNVAAMTEALGTVNTGEVTYAVRDTVIDDVQIKQGDYMGIGDSGILAVGGEIADVTFDMLDKMMDDDLELISVYYGDEVDEKDAEALRERISEKFPSCDVELQFGGQPIYYYIVSAE